MSVNESRLRPERKSLNVPGGRLGLFLFLLFSVPFSRGQSESRGPLELLNCNGSLFVAGSKGSGFRPVEGNPTNLVSWHVS